MRRDTGRRPAGGARRPGTHPSQGGGPGAPAWQLPVPAATARAVANAGGLVGLRSANLSLVFNRLLDAWLPDSPDSLRMDERRRPVFLHVCERLAGQPDARAVLEHYHARHIALLATYSREPWRCVRVRGKLRDRFVSGLGIANPLEVSLALQRIGGFPYVPGSSVKGAARAVAQELQGPEADAVRIAFGPSAEAPRGAHAQPARGALVFFDALPEPGYRLELDIMNPHHSAYYTGNEFPADWQSPTPVTFLAVGRGAVFSFALAVRRRQLANGAFEPAPDADRRLEQAQDWLAAALERGLGGKTSAGYGRFEVQRP